MFALKSLTAVVALDLNFDWAEQKIQDAKIHSLDKETRGKTKKKPRRLRGKFALTFVWLWGPRDLWDCQVANATDACDKHTHAHTHILEHNANATMKNILVALVAPNTLSLTTSWTNRAVPNWPSKNGFKFTRQQEMGTRQRRTRGGEMGAQQQLSRNDVECVSECGGGGDNTKFSAYLNQSYKRASYRSH